MSVHFWPIADRLSVQESRIEFTPVFQSNLHRIHSDRIYTEFTLYCRTKHFKNGAIQNWVANNSSSGWNWSFFFGQIRELMQFNYLYFKSDGRWKFSEIDDKTTFEWKDSGLQVTAIRSFWHYNSLYWRSFYWCT